jgi:predicted transcriptional regulator
MVRKRLRKKGVTLHVGESFDAVAQRVADAWHRAERGEDVHERHVTFVSWAAISRVMTEKRYELLRYLRRHPARSVAALARENGRDYKRVHEDVEALAEIGLIERDHGLRTPCDQIETTISICSLGVRPSCGSCRPQSCAA